MVEKRRCCGKILQRMKKKTVLITGASTGIGRAAALAFAKAGWNVAATMRTPETCGDMCDVSKGGFDTIQRFALDVTDEASIHRAVAEIQNAFGEIDVLVNNAGYGAIGIFEKASAQEIEKQFSVNVFGAMAVTKAVLPQMRKRKAGMIMNISSMGGRLTFPLYSVYHGTKWALEGWSESLQFELEPFHIRVKLIEPGAIKTDFYHRSQIVFNKELAGGASKQYDAYEEEMLEELEEAGENGSSPDVVAQTMVRVAMSDSKRLRYPVGGNARLFLLVRRVVGQRLFSWLVKQVLD